MRAMRLHDRALTHQCHALLCGELRESTDEFSVVLGDMVGLQERFELLQEEIAARLTSSPTGGSGAIDVAAVLDGVRRRLLM